MRFVDTNVLLYAVSTVPADSNKREQALSILDGTDLALSVQVLQEFYVQSTRATRDDRLGHQQAANLIEAWRRYPVQPITDEIVVAALVTCHRWRISYWDAAIVEAARSSRCAVLLSEDLQDAMDFGGVTARNPFP